MLWYSTKIIGKTIAASTVDHKVSNIKKKNITKDWNHGICSVSVVPVRTRPDDKTEIITQMLFGECFTIIGKKGKNWLKIQAEWDNYEGWIDPKQVTLLDEKSYETNLLERAYALDLVHPILYGQNSFPIVVGSSLPAYDGMSFLHVDKKYVYGGQVINPKEIRPSAELIIKVAKKYIHAPYLWGGRSPFGIDCSGLVQNVFKLFDIKMPRDAYQQAEKGEIVDFVDFSNVGDLAFFENKEGRIHHVGIILEDNKIIHASGHVRIDNLDHFGIYNSNRRKYSHQLRFIKRII